jgi:hypothetical protein
MHFRAHALNVLSPNVHESQKPDYRTVDKMVTTLTRIMIDACESTIDFDVTSGARRNRRRRGEDAEISKAVSEREECRRNYERYIQTGEERDEEEALKRAYKEARQKVKRVFTEVTEEENRKVWEKMEKSYREEKAVFHREFSRLAGIKPRQPLPRSLRVDGQEVRKPRKIQREWVRRFQIPHVETGTVEDKAYRHRTEEKNEERENTNTHQ